MKYTIKKLAELAGISTRTLRYYDQIGLLKPNEINKSNYRIYNEKNVNKLQQIMFYRSLDFSLGQIKQLLDDPNLSRLQALQEQKQLLLKRQKSLTDLLTNIDQSIQAAQGEIIMTDSEKFAAFKKEQLQQNEAKFGEEIRQEYGEQKVEQSNQKFGQLTEKEYQTMQKIEEHLIQDLVEYSQNPVLESPLAEKIYQEHRQCLEFTWPKYNSETHKGLVDMYLSDPRFQQYYDQKAQVPVTQLLHDIVYHYAK